MVIQLASTHDIGTIISLIQMRIRWMDNQGIHQWNKSNYLDIFTLEYFKDVIDSKQLYIVKESSDAIVGAFTLFDADERWTDNDSALYIHNFVSHIDSLGVGDAIIAYCENEAKRMGINNLRLDCQKENTKLNNYYLKRRFEYVDSFDEPSYSGNRRERKINE